MFCRSHCTRQPRTASIVVYCRAANIVRWRGLCLHLDLFWIIGFLKTRFNSFVVPSHILQGF